MLKLLLVGIGGFCGSAARYAVSGLAQRLLGAAFPYGTLAVNLAGCLCIGLGMQLVEERQLFSPETRALLLTGVLGGLTTFSTFGYESFALLRNGEWRLAALNCGLNLALGLLAVFAGWRLGRALGA